MPTSDNQRILIVDDTEAIHLDFRKLLGGADHGGRDYAASAAAFFGEPPPSAAASRGFTLDSAFQGAEAIERVRRAADLDQPYALAFVDVRMPPGLDGVETVDQLWKIDPRVQIVICTAFSDYSWEKMVERLGETDRLLILKKPFDNVEVRQLASALCAKWNLERCAAQARERLETDVARRTAQLRANEAHLRAVLDAAADGIVAVDGQGRLLSLNRAAQEMLGVSEHDAIGQNVAVFLPDVRVSEPYPGGAAGAAAATDARQDLTGRRAGGALFPADVAVRRVPSEAAPLFVGVVRDVTQARALEAQLMQAQKLESIGQLAAGIAHEINTPIQYVGDNIHFLSDAFAAFRALLAACREVAHRAPEADDRAQLAATISSLDAEFLNDEAPNAIAQALEGVGRVTAIVGAMKEFAHPGGAAKRPVDLNHGIRSTITVSTNEWKHVAEVVADLDPSLPMITCLPDQINQVFLNLIVNAAHAIREKLGKSSAAKGTIIIQSRRVEDSVEIRVTDTGCGIPPTIASRVFDPFFTTKEVGKGTGQGLAIARSVVVDKHGGTITFESTPGEGTVFIIRLPCRPLDAGVESGESTSEPQGARDTVVLTELKGLLPSTASQHQPAAAE